MAYLGIRDRVTDELLGLTPVTIRGTNILPQFSMEVMGPCSPGPIVLLDADEEDVLRLDEACWTAPTAMPGSTLTVMALTLRDS